MNQTEAALEAMALVHAFFFQDFTKTRLWFASKNPSLGGLAPFDLILVGRSLKLLQFVQNQLAGNPPAENPPPEGVPQ